MIEKEPHIQKKERVFDVREVFEKLPQKELYLGSSTSDFQSEPLLCGPEGKPLVFSDWEMQLVKNLKGEKAGITVPQKEEEFPHFHSRYKEYLSRSKELGEKMFRFSLDFARLCPKEGEFNQSLMADYVKALARIKANGQVPMLTIHHWPMPKYLLKLDSEENILQGGWDNPEVLKQFRFYVEQVSKCLADEDFLRKTLAEEGLNKDSTDKFLDEGLCRYFISINEPTNIFGQGYLLGTFPPFQRGKLWTSQEVLGRLVEAHDITRTELKKGLKRFEPKTGEAQVGIAHNWIYFDGLLKKTLHDLVNRYPTKKMERSGEASDFLALQYYFRIRALAIGKPEQPIQFGDHPEFGDIYPKGIYHVLKEMHSDYPHKEIFITEFGFSDKNDKRRPYWILETVRYALEALKEGVPVKGMLLWSLVNNFEWARGMEQKFGLFSESELEKPLKPSGGEEIRSWEAWQAIIKAIANPSEENLKDLQNYYQKAEEQYIKNLGPSKKNPKLIF